MSKPRSQKPKDLEANMNYLPSFRSFIKQRTTLFNQGVDQSGTEAIYISLVEPILKRGKYKKDMSKLDKEKFIGELFALSVFAKKHKVDNWVYELEINGLTPDFSINSGESFVEVYSPAMNHDDSHQDYYLQADSHGNFTRKNLTNEINKKSKKYKDLPLIIIVHVVVSDFLTDLQHSLQKTKLSSSNHRIIFYHGDSEHLISGDKYRGTRS